MPCGLGLNIIILIFFYYFYLKLSHCPTVYTLSTLGSYYKCYFWVYCILLLPTVSDATESNSGTPPAICIPVLQVYYVSISRIYKFKKNCFCCITKEVLRSRGVNVHIRASRGRDIAAACGQLRHEVKMGATATTPRV